jgi:hypothetical protein
MTLPRSVTDRDKQRGNQHQPSVLPSAEKSSKHAHTFSHTAGRKAAQMTRQTAEPSAASASNHHQLIPMNSLKKSSSKSSLSNLFSGMGKRWGSSVLMESSSTEHSSVIDGSIMPAVSTEIAVDISNVLGLSAQPEEDNDVIPNQCRPSSAAAARQSTDDSVVSSGNETTKKKSLAGFLRTTFRNRSKTVGHPI